MVGRDHAIASTFPSRPDVQAERRAQGESLASSGVAGSGDLDRQGAVKVCQPQNLIPHACIGAGLRPEIIGLGEGIGEAYGVGSGGNGDRQHDWIDLVLSFNRDIGTGGAGVVVCVDHGGHNGEHHKQQEEKKRKRRSAGCAEDTGSEPVGARSPLQ